MADKVKKINTKILNEAHTSIINDSTFDELFILKKILVKHNAFELAALYHEKLKSLINGKV